MEKTVHFVLDRETKNTYVFKETSTVLAIGTLYVQKAALAGSPLPEKLEVTLRAV